MHTERIILVTGATGHVGSELVSQLVARGERVRAMTRTPERLAALRGVEVVRGDFDDPKSLDAAFRGIESLFLMTAQQPGDEETPTHDRAAVDAARRAGVRRIVKLSVLGAANPGDDPLLRWHRQAEGLVGTSGLAWTLLRPGRFMSNDLQWASMIRRDGRVMMPFAHRRATSIDPADVAAVALAALTEPGHEQKAYPLSGPEVLTPAQELALLGDALGRSLELVAMPNEAARAGMLRSGMAPVIVDAIVAQVEADATGYEIFSTVADVTGRPARRFAQWVDAHLDAFR
jgi:uncharacterized protein YbjT (DUF2867 family)